MGLSGHASRAPGRPEVNEDNFSLEFSQVILFAKDPGELKVQGFSDGSAARIMDRLPAISRERMNLWIRPGLRRLGTKDLIIASV